MRIDIYKKHLACIKEKNKSKEWTEIDKNVFSEQIEEFSKYKIMIILSQFKFINNNDNVYYYATPKIYENYLRFYEVFLEQLKSVKIKLVVNK